MDSTTTITSSKSNPDPQHAMSVCSFYDSTLPQLCTAKLCVSLEVAAPQPLHPAVGPAEQPSGTPSHSEYKLKDICLATCCNAPTNHPEAEMMGLKSAAPPPSHLSRTRADSNNICYTQLLSIIIINTIPYQYKQVTNKLQVEVSHTLGEGLHHKH